MCFCMSSSQCDGFLFRSTPNPISIDTSRALASSGDPLIATRDTRHGACDPHDAISFAPTSLVVDSPPRSPTAGDGLARDRGGQGLVPFILRLRRAARARGRRRPRRTDGPRRSRPRTRRWRRIHGRHRLDAFARREVASVSSRASATSRHARVFFRSRCGRVFQQPTRRLVSFGARREPRGGPQCALAAAGRAAARARLPSPRQRGPSRRASSDGRLGTRQIGTRARAFGARRGSVLDRVFFTAHSFAPRTRR